ncbi:hypothetical protein [Lysinibacillus irui]|uniref:hypothetical protein n=1 Tax=Lysinibacillus irui TaxID=2998077 RepID=UPI002AD3B465|nr:hypothetical protein [Lysinibacillus irui]MEA0562496.1 hypothetical protein [Lysinibacillus irui]
MQLGSANYQLTDSYFFIIDPLTVILLGFLFFFTMVVGFVLWKKRKKPRLNDRSHKGLM